MGTFHDGLSELHGITVVVDTNGPRLVIGRCHDVTEEKVILHDADVHEDGHGGVTKRQYLERAAKVGPYPNHRTFVVPRADVTSITRLGEIEVA